MTIAPLVPVWLLLALTALTVALLVFGGWRVAHGHGLRWFRRGLLVLFVLLAGINPVLGSDTERTSSGAVELVFALDTTASSAAEDHGGDATRLDGMRADMRRLLAIYPGARVALVGFDRTANLLLPPSEDVDAARTAIDIVRPELAAYSAGTRLDAPVELLEDVLERVAASRRSRLLVYLGDGEDTSGGADLGRFRDLRGSFDDGIVLGYGTKRGGPMRATTGTSLEPEDYLRDSDGTRVVSRIDEANLRAIADELDVPYLHRTGRGDDDLDDLFDHARGTVDADGIRVSTEVERGGYWLFAGAAAGLALVELLLLVAPLRALRQLPGGRR